MTPGRRRGRGLSLERTNRRSERHLKRARSARLLFRLLGLIVEPHEVTEEASPLPAGGAEGDFGGIRRSNALKRDLGRHGFLSFGVEPRLGTAKPAVVRGHDSRCVTLVTFRRVSRTEALVQGVLEHS